MDAAMEYFRENHRSPVTLLFSLGRWIIILTTFFSLENCSPENKAGPKPQVSVPVTVTVVMRKNVPIQLRVIGNIEAYSVISVKSQVSGEVTKVNFQEGQDVQKGDLLFIIDPRPFESALKQVEANLARDQNQVKQAEANLAKDMSQISQAKANLAKDLIQSKYAEEEAKRYGLLVEKGYVAKEQSEQFRTNADAMGAIVEADQAALENAQAAVKVSQAALESAKATVQADQATVENAKIQLDYCSIRSPLNGRTGTIFIQQGNIVKANDIPMVVINQIHPIYASFSVPEENLSDIKRFQNAAKLKVAAILPNNEKTPEEGVLTFVDNTVDNTTGTIRLKATFENKEKRLWPGQFVNVILNLSNDPDAIVVPSQVVQTGQEGLYAFVVRSDFTVESRPVAVKRTVDGEAVIARGLEPGEKVVMDGQLRLIPGMKVEVKNEPDAGKKQP
jgi:membrane fusion protein, multidrug efflux system